MELGLSLGDQKSSKLEDDHPPLLQLDLLPFSPVPRNSNLSLPPAAWRLMPPDHHNHPFDYHGSGGKRLLGLLVMGSTTTTTTTEDVEEEAGAAAAAMCSSRANINYPSDDDDEINAGFGLTRKKLRLSKDQSVFLEQSFKEHNTLNPKEKVALAKQLNLRPRQVEVWFQNRRARTKLKQTEVECEYLKRCCETLTEENRRLQKELQELRALKANSHPFFMQLPATTLTICPSCERTSSAASAPAAAGGSLILPNSAHEKIN